jgi:UDP-N-acetylglucosamine 2-epimerase (non-hydrolysing)
MSEAFFKDLCLPKPDIHLGVGSGSHASQTGNVMIAYERVCSDSPPDWIVVVGDVNSTMACALVGAKQLIPVAHLEAGLRSRDRTMPEETNRVVTDAVADLLWTPSPDADENLRAEGIPAERIDCVGNIMIDSFELMRSSIRAANSPATYGLTPRCYGVVTMHRPSNVDRKAQLQQIVDQMIAVSKQLPLIFPVHPRTARRLDEFGLIGRLESCETIQLLEPLSYVKFMSLVVDCAIVITDSGGVQEETTYLGIPCLTLRDNTERPVTVIRGTNRLIKPESLESAVHSSLSLTYEYQPIPLWDGKTAGRVVGSLRRHAAVC